MKFLAGAVFLLLVGCSPTVYVIKDSFNTYAPVNTPTYTYAPVRTYPTYTQQNIRPVRYNALVIRRRLR